MRPLIFVLLLPACAGDGTDGGTDDGGTQTPLACDDISTQPLKAVSALDWPSGTAEAHKAYRALDGLWEAEAVDGCGKADEVQIRITTGDPTAFDVVTEPWPTSINCGCTQDTVFQADSRYNAIGFHDMPNNMPSLQILVDPFPDSTAPGGRFRFDDTVVTLFAPGDPLSMRACASQSVDPIQGSDYSDYDAILRQSSAAGLELEVVLTLMSDGSKESCTFNSFQRIE